MTDAPLLLIGGHGITGRALVKVLRSQYPCLKLLIAGRDIETAKDYAIEIGADAIKLDLSTDDFGLDDTAISAVVVLAKDSGLQMMTWASTRAIPYINLSSAAFEHSVDVTHALAMQLKAPVILAGHWHAGAIVAAAIHLGSHFESVQSIVAGVMIDQAGTGGGPASIADFQRVAQCSPTTLARIEGAYVWETEAESRSHYRGASGRLVEGKGAVSLDVASIGAGLGAKNVRVLETWGTSHHCASTGMPADEISIEAKGIKNGRPATGWTIMTLPRAENSLTAMCITALIERTLGLDGELPTAPGLYTPELVIPPESMISRFLALGAQVRTTFT